MRLRPLWVRGQWQCCYGSFLIIILLLYEPFCISDTVPTPGNVRVTDNNMLEWSYVLQPSDLPPDFELVHDFIIAYLVHIRVDDMEAVTTVNVSGDRNYLRLNMVDTCKTLNISVQAVINNELYSKNSSTVINLNGKYTVSPSLYFISILNFYNHVLVPEFADLSASLVTDEENVLIVEVSVVTEHKTFSFLLLIAQVSFGLRQTQCLSVFTIIIETMGTFAFNVTSEDMDNGSARFTLPLNVTGIDVNNVRGVIFGANDAGNSTTADIQLSNGELLCFIALPTIPGGYYVHIIVEAIPTSTITGIPSATPPHATPSPTIFLPSSSGVPTTTNKICIAGISL